MSQWKKIAPFAALSLSMALASTGCLAPSANDETTADSEITATDDTSANAPASEETGEANQACFGFFGCRGCEITPFEDIRLRGFLHSGFPFTVFRRLIPFGCGGCGFGFGGCGGFGGGCGGCF